MVRASVRGIGVAVIERRCGSGCLPTGGCGCCTGLGYIFKNRVRKNYRLVPGSFPQHAYVFTAYVSDFSEKSPVDGVYEGAVTLAATGEPTFDVNAS